MLAKRIVPLVLLSLAASACGGTSETQDRISELEQQVRDLEGRQATTTTSRTATTTANTTTTSTTATATTVRPSPTTTAESHCKQFKSEVLRLHDQLQPILDEATAVADGVLNRVLDESVAAGQMDVLADRIAEVWFQVADLSPPTSGWKEFVDLWLLGGERITEAFEVFSSSLREEDPVESTAAWEEAELLYEDGIMFITEALFSTDTSCRFEVHAAPTTTPPRTQTAPTVALSCPEDFTYPVGSSAMVTFGYEYRFGSATELSFDIDYGDGRSYHAPDADHAEEYLFWHEYTEPGTFTPVVTANGNNGLSDVASCTFTYSWESAPGVIDPGFSSSLSGFDAASCTFNGIPLWGRVQVVDYFADITVQVVDYFSDLRVQEVQYFPSSCGEWQFVDSFGDFTVQFVDYFADVTIQFVDYFPGT